VSFHIGRHLANTIERFCVAAISGSVTRGGDTAYFQITLGIFVKDRSHFRTAVVELIDTVRCMASNLVQFMSSLHCPTRKGGATGAGAQGG